MMGWVPGIQTNLTTFYCAIVLVGLSYSPRGSSSYTYASESMHTTQAKLTFSVQMFTLDGILTMVTSCLFWGGYLTWRIYMIVSLSVILIALLIVALVLPESPVFLYEKGRFT